MSLVHFQGPKSLSQIQIHKEKKTMPPEWVISKPAPQIMVKEIEAHKNSKDSSHMYSTSVRVEVCIAGMGSL